GGEFLVFLNNDVVVDRQWLITLVEQAVRAPKFIYTSKAFFANHKKIINHNGSKLTLIGRGYCLDFGRTEARPESKPRPTIQPYRTSMMLSKTVFEELGGFDEDYFLSLEDSDLGLRAWLFGHGVIYVPTSVFFHYVGGTGG